VLYLERAKMKMDNSVSVGKTNCTFRLVDIRDTRRPGSPGHREDPGDPEAGEAAAS
jgi:hypothetical protein